MSSTNNNEINNSEILIIYEAMLCNPNGDPDDENRPRIDPSTRFNLVSDVRLKRFFRNYIIDNYGEEYIWVSTIEGKHVTATDRYNKLVQNNAADAYKNVLKQCIDARLFGATIPLRGDGEKGRSYSIIGPVQFTWGISLHPVELVDSATITSVFKGREGNDEGDAGTIGKDWRLYYSLIAFYGVVNSTRAKSSLLRKEDIDILDNLLWTSIKMDTTTRSKIGHTPHLYMRVEHKNNQFLIGDLRRYINVNYDNKYIRRLNDIAIDFSKLVNTLQDLQCNIYMKISDEFNEYTQLKEKLKERLKEKLYDIKPFEINGSNLIIT